MRRVLPRFDLDASGDADGVIGAPADAKPPREQQPPRALAGVARVYNVGQDTRFNPGGDVNLSYMCVVTSGARRRRRAARRSTGAIGFATADDCRARAVVVA